jgi:hypothetical protein
MNIVQRVKDILLTPKLTWPVIEAETSDTASLYKNYIMILAAIPALAGFIGMTLIGASVFGMSIKVPFMTGLIQLVVGYVLSLAMVYIISLIVDALAPTFGGQKNQMSALKLVAYGSTAGMVGGIFSLIPMMSMLGLLAALYSIYLIYTGLPTLMKCPEDKALPYTAVILVCGIVAALILGAASAMFTPGPAMHAGSPAFSQEAGGQAEITIKTPDGSVTIDTQKMEDWGQRMEAASKRLEAAQQSGDQAAAEKAMQEMMATMGMKPAQ